MGSTLKHGNNQFRVFEGNMDRKKYVSVLENNIYKIEEMLPKNKYFNKIIINMNQIPHWTFILKIKWK